jgi:hypothetical protein
MQTLTETGNKISEAATQASNTVMETVQLATNKASEAVASTHQDSSSVAALQVLSLKVTTNAAVDA